MRPRGLRRQHEVRRRLHHAGRRRSGATVEVGIRRTATAVAGRDDRRGRRRRRLRGEQQLRRMRGVLTRPRSLLASAAAREAEGDRFCPQLHRSRRRPIPRTWLSRRRGRGESAEGRLVVGREAALRPAALVPRPGTPCTHVVPAVPTHRPSTARSGAPSEPGNVELHVAVDLRGGPWPRSARWSAEVARGRRRGRYPAWLHSTTVRGRRSRRIAQVEDHRARDAGRRGSDPTLSPPSRRPPAGAPWPRRRRRSWACRLPRPTRESSAGSARRGRERDDGAIGRSRGPHRGPLPPASSRRPSRPSPSGRLPAVAASELAAPLA